MTDDDPLLSQVVTKLIRVLEPLAPVGRARVLASTAILFGHYDAGERALNHAKQLDRDDETKP